MASLDGFRLAVGSLDEDAAMGLLDGLIAARPDVEQTQQIVSACQQGMEIVGESYERGEYYVGDLIFAGELLAMCIERLKPLLGSGGQKGLGVIVLGTVEGDIHDIGKNIFRSMAEAAGFRVIDIGVDQQPGAFVEAVLESGADIVGLSGVISLSIGSMKRTVDALKNAGIRDRVKIAIGGNAAGDEACKHAGADAWSKNAADGVGICMEWMRQSGE